MPIDQTQLLIDAVTNIDLFAGFNIVLISRTESKLQAVAADLESRFSVQTKVIAADFSAATEDTWEAISAVVSSVPVGVLINSAGVSYDHAGEVPGQTANFAWDISSPQKPGSGSHTQASKREH